MYFEKHCNFPSVSRQHPIPRKINLRNNCSFQANKKVKSKIMIHSSEYQNLVKGVGSNCIFSCRTCSDFLFIALDSYKEKCGLIENEIMRIRIIEGELLSVWLGLGMMETYFFGFSITINQSKVSEITRAIKKPNHQKTVIATFNFCFQFHWKTTN